MKGSTFLCYVSLGSTHVALLWSNGYTESVKLSMVWKWLLQLPLDAQSSPLPSRGPITQENPNNTNKMPSNTIQLKATPKQYVFLHFPFFFLFPSEEKVHKLVPQGLLIAITFPKLKRYKCRLAHLGLTPDFSFLLGIPLKALL